MDKRKSVATAAVTAAAVASIVTGTVFETPAELVLEVTGVVEVQQADNGEASLTEERQKGPVEKIRNWVLRLPAAVRMLVAVPLWMFGWVILTGASTLWMGAAPLLARALGWICLTAILLAVFALSVKAAFPDVRFRQILHLRNVMFFLVMTALLAVADMALPAVWEGYDVLSRTVWRIGATCLLGFSCCAVLKRQAKRAAAIARQQENVPKRSAVEEEARRLADTVCSPMR